MSARPPAPDLRPPGVILAGGRATRMGGGDKGLRLVAGRSLMARAIERLRPQCGPLALNANGDPARLAGFGLPVLPDGAPGFPGPLAGALAAMDWAAGLGASHVVTAAADTPFFPADLVRRLAEAAHAAGAPMAMAATPDPERPGRLWRHPTFALWPTALREDLRAALASGVRKVVLWTDAHGCVDAPFPAGPFDPFFNVNAPDDIDEAERIVRANPELR
ncbi:molybdenum cofactor guanylyltransferase MobA [Oceanicella actignis]|uniref:Molybdenum cofactor guanylyltransferase n=1 Tax=Oceanicella actignis TaxID=1189325 RepID=A0A1M7TRU9_9RHOB|nr:molybdenum cofactor guanylyltransferase MobA [Oceanicella actignis]SET77605.1 molybdenum cofactor guanylyltransferase [Oceanicella actignis]SHN73445.1 molybdopterin-guanine dinucleotide biosynthesis protein A [Oceanicella actignis]